MKKQNTTYLLYLLEHLLHRLALGEGKWKLALGDPDAGTAGEALKVLGPG